MATDIYASPEPRTVKLYDIGEGATPSVEWLYFFTTKVKSTDVSPLGQTPIDTLPADGKFIIGSNLPRPYRAKNKLTQVSSFCSADKVQTARTAGWSIERAQFSVERNQDLADFTKPGSVIAFVETLCRPGGTATINYAWYLPRKLINKVGVPDITALGINFPTTATEWKSLVFGGGGGAGENTRGPRPPRASQKFVNADGSTDTVTTFYGAGITLPEGWVHVADAIPFIG